VLWKRPWHLVFRPETSSALGGCWPWPMPGRSPGQWPQQLPGAMGSSAKVWNHRGQASKPLWMTKLRFPSAFHQGWLVLGGGEGSPGLLLAPVGCWCQTWLLGASFTESWNRRIVKVGKDL